MENTIIDVQKQQARKQAKQWRTHLHEKHHKTAKHHKGKHAKTKKIDNEFFLFNGADIF